MRGHLSDRPFAGLIGAAALIAGASVTLSPRAFGLSVAGLIGLLILTMPAGRLAWFALGALLVFQSDQGVTTSKLAYLTGVIISVLFAVPRLRVALSEPWGARFKPAVIGAGLLALWIACVTSVQAVAIRGATVETWGRDALTYFLMCAAVLLGIDAAASLGARGARMMAASVGALAAIGFAVAWIGRRGVGGIEEQLLLASMVAVTVPLAMAVTLAFVGNGIRVGWLVYAVGLVSAVLVTGTRTGALLAVIIIGLIGAKSRSRVPASKAAGGLLLVVGGVLLSLPILSDRFTTPGFRESRWNAAVSAITDGFDQDRSGTVRARAYDYAQAIASDFPVMGRGLGQVFPNPNPGGESANFTLDTPWVYIAKFGIVGTLVLASAVGLIMASCLRVYEGVHVPELTATRGAAVAWVALLPFGPPTEDKGFVLSVALIVMLVGAALRERLNDPRSAEDGARV